MKTASSSSTRSSRALRPSPRSPWTGRGARRGRQARRFPPGAEQQLVVAAKVGGESERQRLIDAFTPAIAGVARIYWRTASVDRAELMQEGVVGLLRALQRYDVELGIPFWAYASWWVRQAMQQLVSELSRPLVLSDRALRQLARIKEARRRFEQSTKREPTASELARIVGLPTTQVESLICTERTSRGLDEPAGADEGDRTSVGDLLADPPAEDAFDRVPQQVLASQLPRLLDRLTARERQVVCWRYGIGQEEKTLREIAPMMGVSAERVRQIERDSLIKLHAAVFEPHEGVELRRTA